MGATHGSVFNDGHWSIRITDRLETGIDAIGGRRSGDREQGENGENDGVAHDKSPLNHGRR
jgi:hypothetical protein